MNDGRILKVYRDEKRGKIEKNYWCEGIGVIMSFSEDGHIQQGESLCLCLLLVTQNCSHVFLVLSSDSQMVGFVASWAMSWIRIFLGNFATLKFVCNIVLMSSVDFLPFFNLTFVQFNWLHQVFKLSQSFALFLLKLTTLSCASPSVILASKYSALDSFFIGLTTVMTSWRVAFLHCLFRIQQESLPSLERKQE